MNKEQIIELFNAHLYIPDRGSDPALVEEILAFASAIRDAALEEAAKLCSQMAYSDLLKSEVGECAMAAMQIRALKGTE